MTNQCFWISIADWYKIKYPENNYKDVSNIRNYLKGLGCKINGENSQTVIEGNNDINKTIVFFAKSLDLFIRVFYYDSINKGLNIGADCEKYDNLSQCPKRLFDFGKKNDSIDNTIVIVAYGGHFELVTYYKKGDFEYKLEGSNNEGEKAEEKFYNNEGNLVDFKDLNDETKISIIDNYLYKVNIIINDNVPTKEDKEEILKKLLDYNNKLDNINIISENKGVINYLKIFYNTIIKLYSKGVEETVEGGGGKAEYLGTGGASGGGEPRAEKKIGLVEINSKLKSFSLENASDETLILLINEYFSVIVNNKNIEIYIKKLNNSVCNYENYININYENFKTNKCFGGIRQVNVRYNDNKLEFLNYYIPIFKFLTDYNYLYLPVKDNGMCLYYCFYIIYKLIGNNTYNIKDASGMKKIIKDLLLKNESYWEGNYTKSETFEVYNDNEKYIKINDNEIRKNTTEEMEDINFYGTKIDIYIFFNKILGKRIFLFKSNTVIIDNLFENNFDSSLELEKDFVLFYSDENSHYDLMVKQNRINEKLKEINP